ncbi:MAG: hypothetical protein Q8R55_03340 [Candidatus Taylorbacteria bacterium]|nr:hypothetical protein [Candidatus Taylorbacteria bacterium]
MRNEAIQGWRVKSRSEAGCHIFDVPDDYRSVTIPEGAVGTLTGTVMIFPEGVNEEACNFFAQDPDRIKAALKRDILPNHRDAIRKGQNYWHQTKLLAGDDLLASRVAFVVKWDGIYEQEPGTLHCGSYIPWLELIE